MSVLQIMLDIYFAAVLGVAGIAKISTFPSFVYTLRYQYKITAWNAQLVGRIFPWIEFFLAISFLMPVVFYRFIVLFITLFIFCIFIFFKFLLLKRQVFDVMCGCYGEILQKQHTYQSLITLIIQLSLIILLLFLTIFYVSLPSIYYFVSLLVIGGFYSRLLWKTRNKRLPRMVENK